MYREYIVALIIISKIYLLHSNDYAYETLIHLWNNLTLHDVVKRNL